MKDESNASSASSIPFESEAPVARSVNLVLFSPSSVPGWLLEDMVIVGRDAFVVSRLFCDFRGYVMGLSTLEGGDEGGVELGSRGSEDVWLDRVVGLEDRGNGLK